MSNQERANVSPSRRELLGAATGLAAGAMVDLRLGMAGDATPVSVPTVDSYQHLSETEPFFGEHQAGILTSAQGHTYFAAFDLKTAKREEVTQLLRVWTDAAARMCSGRPAASSVNDPAGPASDTGETLGMPPARLTITFGFGAGLFSRNGVDRFGLATQRPQAMVDLPPYPADQLIDALSGGDLCVQSCAEDPQVAFHAVRELGRLANDAARIRWAQTGFLPRRTAGQTPRNLMGFKDGTRNPSLDDSAQMEQFVWAGSESPAWMQGGSYLVVRRIRMALERWDRLPVASQEQTIGRRKASGAPIGGRAELDPPDLDARDADGNSLIADNAHIRLAAPESNGGARIFRRVYSYNDGVNFTSERWAPWRQGMEYDAGLLFLAYQRDPRNGFIKIFDAMSRLDALNPFMTHTGSGLFACPRGASRDKYIGQWLFATA